MRVKLSLLLISVFLLLTSGIALTSIGVNPKFIADIDFSDNGCSSTAVITTGSLSFNEDTEEDGFLRREVEIFASGPFNTLVDIDIWHDARFEGSVELQTEDLTRDTELEARGTGYIGFSVTSDNFLSEKKEILILPGGGN